MRSYQHIIDTKAVRLTMNSIPEHCVVRGLSERDYGIDLMVEIFIETGENKDGHKEYDTSGHVCYPQIKGTDKPIVIMDDGTIHVNIKRAAFLHAERFATPFVLVRAGTLVGSEVVYYLWMQRYISDVLDFESPSWRTDQAKSFTVKLPAENVLPGRFDKIERIASRIKYLEDFAEYHERFSDVLGALQTIIYHPGEFTEHDALIAELSRIRNLTTLMKLNNCSVDVSSIDDLIGYIRLNQTGSNVPDKLEDFPNHFNLDLLNESGASLRFIEELVAENEGKVNY